MSVLGRVIQQHEVVSAVTATQAPGSYISGCNPAWPGSTCGRTAWSCHPAYTRPGGVGGNGESSRGRDPFACPSQDRANGALAPASYVHSQRDPAMPPATSQHLIVHQQVPHPEGKQSVATQTEYDVEVVGTTDEYKDVPVPRLRSSSCPARFWCFGARCNEARC